MNGTGNTNRDPGGPNPDHHAFAEHDDAGAYPPPVVSVRLGEVRAFRVLDDENEPVLVVSDGETSVEFGCGLSGVSGSAARGAQRLADAVRDYASDDRGQSRPIAGRSPRTRRGEPALPR